MQSLESIAINGVVWTVQMHSSFGRLMYRGVSISDADDESWVGETNSPELVAIMSRKEKVLMNGGGPIPVLHD